MCSGNPITVGYNGRFLREAVIGMETIAQECCSEVCMEGRVTEGAPKGVTRTKSHPQRSGLEVTEPLGLERADFKVSDISTLVMEGNFPVHTGTLGGLWKSVQSHLVTHLVSCKVFPCSQFLLPVQTYKLLLLQWH